MRPGALLLAASTTQTPKAPDRYGRVSKVLGLGIPGNRGVHRSALSDNEGALQQTWVRPRHR